MNWSLPVHAGQHQRRQQQQQQQQRGERNITAAAVEPSTVHRQQKSLRLCGGRRRSSRHKAISQSALGYDIRPRWPTTVQPRLCTARWTGHRPACADNCEQAATSQYSPYTATDTRMQRFTRLRVEYVTLSVMETTHHTPGRSCSILAFMGPYKWTAHPKFYWVCLNTVSYTKSCPLVAHYFIYLPCTTKRT